MVLKQILKHSTMLYVSSSTIDILGFELVWNRYFKKVPKDTAVKGLNMSPFGCPAPLKTKYGDMIALEFMTTDDVFGDIDQVESVYTESRTSQER